MAIVKPSIQQLYWEDVREDFVRVAPKFCPVIDAISPGHDYPFVKVTYPYGSKILHDGYLYFPDENGNLGPLSQLAQRNHIHKQLAYSLFPIGFVTQNSMEIFVELPKRVIPLRVLTPGAILGLWESLTSPTFGLASRAWSITAGARSLFMLPKITDINLHARLKREFNITAPIPNNNYEHWPIFRELANHEAFPDDWQLEIIYFSEKWMNQSDDPEWLKFHLYLYGEAWDRSLTTRNKEIMEYIWEDVVIELEKKNIKVKANLIDTFWHIIHIAIGIFPGFRPAVDNNLLAPITGLQKVFVESYGLKYYLPTMMLPTHLSQKNENNPVYYSLQSPTLIAHVPQVKYTSSIINDLRDLKSLTDLLSELHNLAGTHFHRLFKDVEYAYFHTENDALDGIYSSHDLVKQDPAFLYGSSIYPDRRFSDNSQFLRGCIGVGLK